MWVQSLGGEDPLEESMATHSNILAWKIPCTEEPGGLQSMGPQGIGHDWATNTNTYKKEQNWVICRDVDGPREGHIDWSKSEKEKQISCINTCMWNLEKQYRQSYLQSRNRDTNTEDKYMDTKFPRLGGGEAGRNRWLTNTYWIINTGVSASCTVVLWVEGNPKGKGTCLDEAEPFSLCSRD